MTEVLISTRQEEKRLIVSEPFPLVESLLRNKDYFLHLTIQNRPIVISKKWIVWISDEEEAK